MHILFTNNTLDSFAGSELYIYDLARELKARNHQITCFTLNAGKVADKLKEFGIETTNDLSTVKDIDVIHAHHRHEFKIAAAYFPFTPLVYVSHSALHPQERPTGGKNLITRYVAVSEAVGKLLIETEGISPDLIDIVPNFADIPRFTAKNRIAEKPQRVLINSSYYEINDIIREACTLAGIQEIEKIGAPSKLVWDVENYIERADLVITVGKGAIEAMAMGRAVIVYRPVGADGMVTTENFEKLCANNFSSLAFSFHYDAAQLAAEINKYNREDAEAVMYRVRQEMDVSCAADKLLNVYKRAIADFQSRWTAAAYLEKTQAMLKDLGDYLIFLKDQDTNSAGLLVKKNRLLRKCLMLLT